MPAKSKSQQKFIGLVHAVQKGDIKPDDVSAKAQKVAKTMKKKDVTDFAKTKHKGLPEKVPENYIVDENTLTDLPDDVEYGYTRDGVVQCIASKNICLTRMRTDRERNPGSKFQFIYSPTQQVGEMFESITEAKEKAGDMAHDIYSRIANGKRAWDVVAQFGLSHISANDKEYDQILNVFNNYRKLGKDKSVAILTQALKTSRIAEAWVSGGDKKYDRNNIPDGTTVKVVYGKHEGKIGKVVDDAPADGYSIVKVGSDKSYYHNSDLLVKENKMNESKFKIGDVVANKRTKWIGIVRSEEDRGELRTDADGMVYIKNLEKYDPKKHKNYHIAPSTKKEIGESIMNEIKSDQDMAKDGLRYGKKKYKYDAKKLKDLAKDLLTYIKSGEIDDELSIEAYIDFRHDEISMDEGQFMGSIVSDARALSSGTMASLTGKQKHDEIQKIQNDFVKFASQNKTKYKNWHDAWRVFWKRNEIKEVIRGVVREVLNEKVEKSVVEAANPKKGRKSYYTMDNLGSSKYSISYYDGKATHKDGSPFYGIKLFKNKQNYQDAIKDLTKQGYVEESVIKK